MDVNKINLVCSLSDSIPPCLNADTVVASDAILTISLKFKAACYLISNLENKYYNDGQKIKQLNRVFPVLASNWKVKGNNFTEKEKEAIWDSIQKS